MRISDWSSDVCSSDLGAVEAMRRQRLLQGLGLHHIGIMAVAERRDAVTQAILVGMHDQVEPEVGDPAVAEGDHVAEFPGGVDMQQRKWRPGRMKCQIGRASWRGRGGKYG